MAYSHKVSEQYFFPIEPSVITVASNIVHIMGFISGKEEVRGRLIFVGR